MQKIARKLEATQSLLKNFSTNIRKTAKSKQTKGFFTARKNLLESYWTQYKEAREDLLANIYDGAKVEEVSDTIKALVSEDSYMEIEIIYSEMMGELIDELESTEVIESPGNNETVIKGVSSMELTSNLPRIKIPSFDGNYLHWYAFKDLFTSVVSNNVALSNTQKLQYLKDALVLDAQHALDNITTTDAHWAVAWSLLVRKYENKRIILNAYLKQIVNLTTVSDGLPNSLRLLCDTITSAVRALEQLGRPVQHWDDWLVFTLLQKLDTKTRSAWELSTTSLEQIPKFEELVSFLENRIHSLEVVNSMTDNSNQEKKFVTPIRTKGFVKSHHTTVQQCVHCQGKHLLAYCAEFRQMTGTKRYEVVRSARLCFNCLRTGHMGHNCPSKYRCLRCNAAHHTLLHDHSGSGGETNYSNIPEKTTEATKKYAVTSNNTYISSANQGARTLHLQTVLIGTALIEVRSPSGQKLIVRALLDSAAEATFVSEFIVQRLKLDKTNVIVPVSGANGERVANSRGMVSFTIHSLKSDFNMNCVALILPRVGSVTPTIPIPKEALGEFMNLDLADPQLQVPGAVDMILSASDYAAIVYERLKRHPTNNIVAQYTQLGWVIFGGLSRRKGISVKGQVNCCHTRATLHEMLHKFWELEEITNHAPLTKDEMYCEDFFERTTVRNATGRYVVRLPIKQKADLATLKSSKLNALALLNSTLQRLTRDPDMYKLYQDFMDEYQTCGHMEVVPHSYDVASTCYLPHHGVYKASSSTTKLRVVFNASNKCLSGISLNDCLHIGPRLQNDLSNIILQWRHYPIVFTGDIEKMYRQILVDSKDVDLQRIMWRVRHGDAPTTFRLLTLTYGTNCAPYLAIKVLRTLAKEEQTRFPRAAESILNEFYIDDVLSGGDTPIEAAEKLHELQELLATAGFTLRKFNSNSNDVLSTLTEDVKAHADDVEINTEYKTKTLGLTWYTKSDSFGYSVNVTCDNHHYTKRLMLSDISKLFDPLGFLAPVIIRGKMFLQQLWRTGSDWDDPLSIEMANIWHNFRIDLQQLHHIRIPRWINTTSTSAIELHAFGDSSNQAYAAAVYAKTTIGTTSFVNLLISKTKVAPLKETSIQRLELCAALLAAKLLHKVKGTFKCQPSRCILWTDNTTTLWWIRTDPGKLKQFVANRVSQIQSMTNIEDWRYIATKDNPADCASRGSTVLQLKDNLMWWYGPSWLRLNEKMWPNHQINHTADSLPEKKEINSLTTQLSTEVWEIFGRYATLDKLLVVVAQCLRFIHMCQKRMRRDESFCTWQERYTVLKKLVTIVQRTEFTNDYAALRKGNPINKSSKLFKLNPKLDSDGIMRLNGRLQNANIPSDERCPMILPKCHDFTTLIINHAHSRTLHGGTQTTLAYMRRQFWVIEGRSAVKRVINKCITCFRQACRPQAQLMGNLPPARCNISQPFMHTGVDYAGPFNVRATRGRGHRTYKGYVALFICFITRAIHLELVSDMTSETFLAALKRFVSVRGICSDMYIDRGTSFVGADALMKDEIKLFKKQIEAGSVFASTVGINWHFIPLAAPHFGGLWEAGVKIENCLNSRPLTALSDDPTDLSALTPGHFLIGRAPAAVPEPNLLNTKIGVLFRWKMLSQMYQDFWRRWSQEYLTQLHARNKWTKSQTNVATGQLVLLRDERLPPSSWLLGRIIQVHPGTDGAVRVVTIQTQSAIVKRPITKISVLPIDIEGRPEAHE
ncbi:uncharacterized protein LOC119663766 [Teleopsis dalmanni]|uniref:uncharacterized protein LOC119663766 n=2 Tax=Teleopsis dalmanni TaxID=139649 RepID=UPI0018CCF2D7|nr:uncharacterized protein LOC119663766 [Teleopsis dalmanni]